MAMGLQVNQETVNDTAKLMIHRLVARALAHDPSLVERAKTLAARNAERYPARDFVRQWDSLLKLPLAQIRSRLTSRDPEMYQLRLSSPFALVEELGLADENLRRRIGRAARRVAERRASHAAVAAALAP
jgi:hypothetical protein